MRGNTVQIEVKGGPRKKKKNGHVTSSGEKIVVHRKEWLLGRQTGYMEKRKGKRGRVRH